MTTTVLAFAIDLVAIIMLTFALYFPRHRRRELVVAYLGVNVGVLAVSAALSSGAVAAGLGLGLFGVLSIIRLRSDELGQHEVAYYFSALALGLIGGLGATSPALGAALSVLVLLALFLGDHPRLLSRHRSQLMHLDAAFTDHTALVAHLEGLLGARVHVAAVQKVDLVLQTTLVDVRYETGRSQQVERSTFPERGAVATGRIATTGPAR
ncbi:DUF4956 domain-containing protein [Cellulomonas sp. 179-A 4D5 NHS]|uniref:DUF4956 domain-containing protein n=1 Tax=Cellulomonas sp. 179-A 4D5 NHS TaxID=3142378 RepID=UPI0039A3AE0F